MVTSAALQAIPYFAEFTPAELDSLAALMVDRVHQAGEIIFLERQPIPGLFFVARGRVRVFKTSATGKEQALCLMTPRTCFGGCPLFDGNLSPVTAQAIDEVVVYILPRVEAIAQARSNPTLARAVFKTLASRLNHLTTVVDGLTFKCTTERLAELLLAFAEERGWPTDRGIEFDLDLTQDKMASLVGTTREVVTRSLLRLERLGAIEARGRHIIILNRDKLMKVT